MAAAAGVQFSVFPSTIHYVSSQSPTGSQVRPQTFDRCQKTLHRPRSGRLVVPETFRDSVHGRKFESRELGFQRQQLGKKNAVRWLRPPRRSRRSSASCEGYSDALPHVIGTPSSRKPASSPSQDYLSAHECGGLRYWIMTASSSDERLAAATLRAQLCFSFQRYATTGLEDVESIKARLRHQLGMRDLMKSRLKAELERDAQMERLNMNVKSILAVCQKTIEEVPATSGMDSGSFMTPPAVGSKAFSSKPLVAIGTLDVQDGTGTKVDVDSNIVTFQLFDKANSQRKKRARTQQIVEQGHGILKISPNGKPQVRHGYVFNLFVAEPFRKHGVATAIMREAGNISQRMKLQILYVHVEADNIPALGLYQKLDFNVEEVESPDVEIRFRRPRRMLLSYSCK